MEIQGNGREERQRLARPEVDLLRTVSRRFCAQEGVEEGMRGAGWKSNQLHGEWTQLRILRRILAQWGAFSGFSKVQRQTGRKQGPMIGRKQEKCAELKTRIGEYPVLETRVYGWSTCLCLLVCKC
jgi:hypothetical protein